MRDVSVLRRTVSHRWSVLGPLLLASLLASLFGAATATAAPRPELLIQTEQLAERLDEPDLVILHVGADRESFDGGHVPGARFLEWSSIATTRDGVANEFPDRRALRKTFADLGVGDDSSVVLYDAAKGLPSARAFVALEWISFEGRVAVLDGQLAAWVSENRPLQVGPPKRVEKGKLSLPEARAVVVQAEDLRRALVGGGTQLVDARSPAEWSGEKAGRDIAQTRGGHLPGAINVPWTDHLSDEGVPRLKDLKELQRIYASLDASAPVATYCRTGVKASHTYFVLKLLGYEPHLYDGSYSEWHADSDLPIERPGAPAANAG